MILLRPPPHWPTPKPSKSRFRNLGQSMRRKRITRFTVEEIYPGWGTASGRPIRLGRGQIRGWPAECTCPPLQPKRDWPAGQPAQVEETGQRTREVTLDPGYATDTPVETKGQAGACPEPTRAIPRGAGGHTVSGKEIHHVRLILIVIKPRDDSKSPKMTYPLPGSSRIQISPNQYLQALAVCAQRFVIIIRGQLNMEAAGLPAIIHDSLDYYLPGSLTLSRDKFTTRPSTVTFGRDCFVRRYSAASAIIRCCPGVIRSVV